MVVGAMVTEETLADTLTVREATGVFRTKGALEQAIKRLLTLGLTAAISTLLATWGSHIVASG